ncbi:MAG: class I SAM-dependent methyltransferase [Woeseiaceae bacterium]
MTIKGAPLMQAVFTITFLLVLAASAAADTDPGTVTRIQTAMAADLRGAGEIARDENRKPVETLSFFGLRDDMRVLELLPGGGWYTKLLAPTLRDEGKLYLAIGTGNVAENLLGEEGFDRVEVLDIGVDMVRDGPFRTSNLAAFDFGVRDLDMVLTFRNMHNFTPEGRASIDAAVFGALKKGGIFGVVDHTRRHMEPMTMENRRRADPVEIILELQQAGFEFVAYSDLHYRPDDELRYEVGRKTVTGNTDRYTLMFRKP